MDLQIIPRDLLEQYKMVVSEEDLFTTFNQLEDTPLSTDKFSFFGSSVKVGES